MHVFVTYPPLNVITISTSKVKVTRNYAIRGTEAGIELQVYA